MELQELQSIFSYLDIKKFAKENSIDYPHLTRVLKGEVNLTERIAAKIKVGLMDLHKIFENYIKITPKIYRGFYMLKKSNKNVTK